LILVEALEALPVEKELVEMLRLAPVDWLVFLEETVTMLPIIIRLQFAPITYLIAVS
jgi:hypothetical protein